MKMLTAKEEEIMGYFWEKGPLFVKQLLDFYDEPRPHFNTLSTICLLYTSHTPNTIFISPLFATRVAPESMI